MTAITKLEHSRHAEVLVVGAGPAGMAAAISAASQGRTVLVLDDNPAVGGQIWRGASKKPVGLEAKMRAAFLDSGAELVAGHTVVDIPRPHLLHTLFQTNGEPVLQSFAWDRLVIATGARERFIPFPGWTIPGVFGAGGLQALVRGGYPVTGKRVIVAGSGPLLLAVAAHLRDAGATIVTVVEQAEFKRLLPFAAALSRYPSKLFQGAGYRASVAGSSYRIGAWIESVQRSASDMTVTVTNGGEAWEEQCDMLACGFHLVPNTELAYLLGCNMADGYVTVDENQQTSVQGVFCAGETTAIAGLDAALVQGEIAGLAAAGTPQKAAALYQRRAKEKAFGARLEQAFRLRSELRTLAKEDTIVCRCEDVPFSKLKDKTSWTEAKLQTRCGMGPCQGRICGPAVQTLFGWQLSSIRPPIFPVPVAALSGNYISRDAEVSTQQETV
jgi:NADPH-dependent 2,4-dienoyl-CoA reductase/sulfur reductase-like enzyme